MRAVSDEVIVASEAVAATNVPVRLAHLVSHPIQYFVPLYRELARRPEIDLTVYFYSDESLREFTDHDFDRTIAWDVPLLDGYRSVICPSARDRSARIGKLSTPSWDLLRAVRHGSYDVVWVHGHACPNAWLAALGLAGAPERLLVRSDSTLLDEVARWRSLAKGLIVRGLFSRSHMLYVGENNRRYWRYHGVSERRLYPVPHCVDSISLDKRGRELARDRGNIRRALGISDDAPAILFVGKFTPKKRPLAVLKAFERVRAQRRCWLLLVGSGPQQANLESYVRERHIPNVLMPGFMNQTELPCAYTAGDVFTLPSAFGETWGLVVNEAMNFSLPIVVSDRVGCAADLVQNGWNGYVIPHEDTEALERALVSLVADESKRYTFGSRSRELVRQYSVERCADGIVRACLEVVGDTANNSQTIR